MQKRNTVEEDLQWGPLKRKDIFFKEYTGREEVHILVKVYKYRVFVGQFDTTSEIWGVVGEAVHSIEVEVARYWFDRKFKTKSEPRAKWLGSRAEAVLFAEEFGLTAKDMNRSFIIPSRSGGHRDLNLSGDAPSFANIKYPIWETILRYKKSIQ